jgi:ankyrin repeat protein
MPLHHAAGNGHEERVELLLRADADKDARSRLGKSPIHWVAHGGRVGCLELLRRASADKDAIN